MALKAGFYWARFIEDGDLTIVQVSTMPSGAQDVMFMGNLHIEDMEDAEKIVKFIARIPEPE